MKKGFDMSQGAARERKVSWESRLTARQAGAGPYQQKFAVPQDLCRSRADPAQTTVQIEMAKLVVMRQDQGQAKKSGQQIRLGNRLRKVQGWVKMHLHSSSHRDQEHS